MNIEMLILNVYCWLKSGLDDGALEAFVLGLKPLCENPLRNSATTADPTMGTGMWWTAASAMGFMWLSTTRRDTMPTKSARSTAGSRRITVRSGNVCQSTTT